MASGDISPGRLSDTMRLRTTRIGLVGYGAVGTKVARILLEKSAHITRKTGRYIQLARVVDTHPHRPRPFSLPEGMLTDRLEDLLESDIPIVAVLVGSVEDEMRIIHRLIQAGKSVVTANAHLMATHGAELVQTARERHVTVSFGAAVGEGLPLVGLLRDELVASDVGVLFGVLNVTANFILTTMDRDGISFEQALEAATRLGIAEPDPAEDFDGHDSAHKLAIIANMCFHSRVDVADIYYEGISDLGPDDLALARAMGYRIKLLSTGINSTEQADLRVHPTLIPESHPLAGVQGARCGLYCVGDNSGPLMFTGFDAGGAPTAGAVIADLVNVALRREDLVFKHAEMFPVAPKAEVRDIMTRIGQYLLSFEGLVGEEELAEILALCKEEGIGVEQTATCGNLTGLITAVVEEEQIMAFATRQGRDRGLRQRTLRLIDTI